MGNAADSSPGSDTGAAWARYWASARVAACLDAAESNYAGRLRTDWERFFAELAPGATVLDLATGNGAVAAIAAAVSREGALALEVHGVDSAPIDPLRYAGELAEELAAVRFHASTPAESLPFAAASVDAACGQYALEYTDTARSVPELARVLRDGGSARFVLHARESVVWRASCRQLELSEWMAGGLDLPGALAELLRAESEAGPAASADCKQRFQRLTAQALQAADGEAEERLVAQVLGTLAEVYERRHEHGFGRAAEELEEARGQLADHAARLRALTQAARSREGVERLAGEFADAGFVVDSLEPVQDDRDAQIGWCLRASRSGAD